MSDLIEKIVREYSHDADGIGGEIEEVIAVSHLPEIISLCQPQWISEELQIIVNEIKRSMGDFKFQLLVDDLEGIIAKLEPPEESK